jgi:hypothetical protein
VVITNQYGSITSSNATVTVLDDQGIFQITSLLTTGVKVIDHNNLTDDDRGGIAVTRDHVFITGDIATARYNAADLTGGLQVAGPRIENLVTDLRTETVYRFANGTNLVTFGDMTSLVEMNASGGLTGRRINLSRPVPLFGDAGVFAGYGRIVIHNGAQGFQHLFAKRAGEGPRPDVAVHPPVFRVMGVLGRGGECAGHDLSRLRRGSATHRAASRAGWRSIGGGQFHEPG